MLTLIENNALDSYRTDSMTRLTRLGRQEELIEYGLMTTFSGIIQQCSSEIFDVRSITCCVTSLHVYCLQCVCLWLQVVLRRLRDFVTKSVHEHNVAGRFTCHLLRAASKVRLAALNENIVNLDFLFYSSF